MSAATRRALATAIVVVAVVLALAAPAIARFADSSSLPSTTVTTGTVAPPTNVTAVLGSCANNRWMAITVSWTGSPSRGVSGYAVHAHRNDGSTEEVGQTTADVTSISTTVDKLSTGATTVTFTVTTQTTYGWTADSTSSGPLTC